VKVKGEGEEEGGARIMNLFSWSWTPRRRELLSLHGGGGENVRGGSSNRKGRRTLIWGKKDLK